MQGDFGVFEDFAERAVADPVRGSEVFVVADTHRALLNDLAHGGVGQHEASSAVAEFDVVDVEVLADVVRLARVEISEILQEVVPAEEGVCFEEHKPLGIGHLLIRAVDHGQKLPLVELPALVPGVEVVAFAGAGLGHDDPLAVDMLPSMLLQLMIQLEIVVLIPPLLRDTSVTPQDIVHSMAFNFLIQVR